MSQSTTDIMLIMWQFWLTYLLYYLPYIMTGLKNFFYGSRLLSVFVAAVILLAGVVGVEIILWLFQESDRALYKTIGSKLRAYTITATNNVSDGHTVDNDSHSNDDCSVSG